MIPQFIRTGKRGGPLRPTGSSSVPTNVRPYRVSSGALRILVRLLIIKPPRSVASVCYQLCWRTTV